ncbi:MAG TPA: transglutaminase-like domain-containing protein [Candidatus Acidoferrales bacterium]|jgi:transglutaminase-like putative cysteine protease|nr:transglutaminase-like domain-containing protein [Candidatus Acidoferrales bacterium]
MNKRRALLMLILLAAVAAAALALVHDAPASASPQARTFDVTYTAEVHDIPAGTKEVSIWLPYPQDDAYQKILKANVTSAYPTKISTGEYGNRILQVAVKNPGAAAIPITMEFTVRRSEHVHNDFAQISAPGRGGSPLAASLKRWLEPDHLVPLDQRIHDLSAEVTAGKTTPLEKARAIYDYVLANMKYDKSGTGWGNGDIYWACDAKRGNCTDFHALFIGLARAAGIPAKFEIGLPVPADKPDGEIGGYHCWAEFYLEGYGWVPVDASEAWKDPSRRDYFFGAHDANRVQFSVGRDLTLAPPQAGPPLNYFIYPYIEVDGKPFAQVSRKFSFRDVPAAGAAAGGN